MRRPIRFACLCGWYLLVAVLALMAIAVSSLRLLMPLVEDYRGELEARLSRMLGQPVSIATLDASWRGFEPLLVLHQVALLSDDRSRSLLRFDSAKIGVDLWASLRQARFVPGTLIISGARIHLSRHADGRISIASLPATANDRARRNRLGEWLLSRRLLELQDSELHWRDLRRPQAQAWVFSQVNLRIDNRAAHHRISGSVSLPARLGERLQVALDIQGDVLGGRDWSGEAFVAASALQLAPFLGGRRFQGAELVSAVAGGAVWASWHRASLVSVRGRLRLDDVRLRSAGSASLVGIDQLSSRFAWLARDEGWRLGLDDFYLHSGARIWPSSSLFLEYRPGQQARLMLSHLDLGVLARLQGLFTVLPAPWRERLHRLQPTGSVSEVFANLALDRARPVYLVQGKLRDFALRGEGDIPGLKQLAGDFVLTPDSGSFQLRSRGLVVDYPRVFEQVFYLSEARGFVHWQRRGEAWHLGLEQARLANREIDLSLRAELDLPADGGSPFVDLSSRLNRAVSTTVAKRYLPVGVLKPKILAWIRNAIGGGRISDAGFVWYGAVKDFPYRDGSGKLELRLGLKEGRLRYARAWPEIDRIEGEFVYRGYGLSFTARHGRSVGHTLSPVQVSIADFRARPLMLRIEGEAEGLTQDKLEFLHQSPLEARFASKLRPMQWQGRSRLHLKLAIPLRQLARTEVQGVLQLRRNRLDAPAWKLALDQIDGELHFDRQGLASPGLRGWLGGVLPLNLTVDTLEVGERRELMFAHTGRLDREKLDYVLRHFVGKPHWARYWDGETQVLAQLKIPLRSSQPIPIRLHLNSNLKGAAITLPPPLAKAAVDPRLFRLTLDLTGEKRLLALRYGQADARFLLTGHGIERGAVGFGAALPLPQEHGFRYQGRLARFSWSQWRPLIFPAAGEPPLLGHGGPGASHYFDVDIDSLEVFGAEFGTVKLQAANSSQGWNLSVDGPALAGNVFIPLVKNAPMTLDMSRLLIPQSRQDASTGELDPREMPVLKVDARRFRFHELEFGRLKLRSSRLAQGLHLDELRMQTEHTRIDARGDWTVQDQRQRSRFTIAVETQDLGGTLKEWGYAGSIAGGVGRIDIDAAWPGRPTQFAFEHLQGRLSMNIEDGSLLEVKPGAARLFGLLSLQALPRRLFLDFSDVFASGMSFDELKGEFRLEGGNAFTDSLRLDGPSASIVMAGRVGLVQRDYDQVVTVVPKVGASLPLLGALAVTPQVGATLFVVQKLLQKQIDDISALQYIVTGSWENPDIRRIAKPGEALDEDSEQ